MAAPGYGSHYRRLRAAVLADDPLCGCTGCKFCQTGCRRRATTVDHVPPLASVPDPLMWEGVLMPCCLPCNQSRGGTWGTAKRWGRVAPPPSRVW